MISWKYRMANMHFRCGLIKHLFVLRRTVSDEIYFLSTSTVCLLGGEISKFYRISKPNVFQDILRTCEFPLQIFFNRNVFRKILNNRNIFWLSSNQKLSQN